ncbi:MAG: haloacid dehalogenase [Patescibacteria group bacterium]|jgi:beta-phosphoglucomutase|nr:haloacid dehalogenase [Patescibacteria group bacterium]
MNTATTLALSELDALIFDLNGTMINDGAYHREAFRKFFEKYDLSVSKEEYEQKVHARRSSEIFPALFNRNLSDEEITEFIHEKESLYRELCTPHIKEIAGLSTLIAKAKDRGIKLAVASSSPPENIDFALTSLGLTNAFQSVINGYEIEKPKPDPEIYLRTLETLGVAPERCLVFEDSKPGITAATTAHIRVIGVLTEETDKDLREAGAESTINDFTEIIFA